MCKQRGITLVELVIFITVAAIMFIPLSAIITEITRRTVLPEYYTAASRLAEEKTEEILNKRFSEITNEGPVNYPGNFSQYSYQISFYYSQAADPDTPSAGITDYKRVLITIRRNGFPDVDTVTLVSNNKG